MKRRRRVQTVVAALAFCASDPALSQSEMPIVQSTNPDCAYEMKSNPARYRFSCKVSALIVDPAQGRRIGCLLTLTADYVGKSGGNNVPGRHVIYDIVSQTGGSCFVQPNLGYAGKSIFLLDNPKGPPTGVARAHLHLIYDGNKVTTCMSPAAYGNNNVLGETACLDAKIFGDF